jgi:ubiquinone/menaquinone biosynthesis C-methylase UbiE
MKKASLYQELAKYYDLIYSFKDFSKESREITGLISKYKKRNGKDLLEVACGTGEHLKYLKKKYHCVGVDLNQGMLDVAKKKVKGVKFQKANMINFKLNKKFDIITCLFSSIGYVKTKDNLRKSINNFSKHLKPNGLLLIEPWFTKQKYRPGFPHMTTYQDDNIKLARCVVSEVKGNVSVMDMNYLVAEKNKKVKHFIDRHEMGMFNKDDTLKIMRDAGFKVKYLKKGLMKDRGLYIGIKK